jgi:hypothetical protein
MFCCPTHHYLQPIQRLTEYTSFVGYNTVKDSGLLGCYVERWVC